MTTGVTLAVLLLLSGVAVCGWAGYRMRTGLLVGMVLAGLAANALWMVAGLGADPLSRHALMAQGALILYAVGAFGFGWLAGRLRRRSIEARANTGTANHPTPRHDH